MSPASCVIRDQTRADERSFRTPVSRQEILQDLEKLIAFLNKFQVAVRGMYEQGRAPKLRPMRWSVRSLAKRKLKDLSLNVSQEDIVAEAKICMALLTHGANALPRASRRSLRWGDLRVQLGNR